MNACGCLLRAGHIESERCVDLRGVVGVLGKVALSGWWSDQVYTSTSSSSLLVDAEACFVNLGHLQIYADFLQTDADRCRQTAKRRTISLLNLLNKCGESNLKGLNVSSHRSLAFLNK